MNAYQEIYKTTKAYQPESQSAVSQLLAEEENDISLNIIKRINLLLTKMHYLPEAKNTLSICFTPLCNGTKEKT